MNAARHIPTNQSTHDIINTNFVGGVFDDNGEVVGVDVYAGC